MRRTGLVVMGLAVVLMPMTTTGTWSVTVGTHMSGFEPIRHRTVPVAGRITPLLALRAGDGPARVQATRRLALGVSMLLLAARA